MVALEERVTSQPWPGSGCKMTAPAQAPSCHRYPHRPGLPRLPPKILNNDDLTATMDTRTSGSEQYGIGQRHTVATSVSRPKPPPRP